MDIIRRNNEKYGIQKVGKNRHVIIKILHQYDNEKDAMKDLTRLMTGEITEQELIEGGNKSSSKGGF